MSGSAAPASPCRPGSASWPGTGATCPPLGHRDEVNPGIFEDTGAGLILGCGHVRLRPRRVPDRPAVGGGRRSRSSRASITARSGPEPRRRAGRPGPGVPARARDRPPAGRLVDVRLARPLPGAVNRTPPGGGRGRDLRPSPGNPAGRPLHQRAGPRVGLAAGPQPAATRCSWAPRTARTCWATWPSSGPPAGPAARVGRRPRGPDRPGGARAAADWAEQCHAAGGLVVGAHFPLPYAEIAADIVAGAIDAVEMQCFAPGLDNPSILEWYRFLNCGYRLPVRGRHGQDVGRGAGRRGPHVCPPRSGRRAELRGLVGSGPGRAGRSRRRDRSSSCWSRVASRAA